MKKIIKLVAVAALATGISLTDKSTPNSVAFCQPPLKAIDRAFNSNIAVGFDFFPITLSGQINTEDITTLCYYSHDTTLDLYDIQPVAFEGVGADAVASMSIFFNLDQYSSVTEKERLTDLTISVPFAAVDYIQYQPLAITGHQSVPRQLKQTNLSNISNGNYYLTSRDVEAPQRLTFSYSQTNYKFFSKYLETTTNTSFGLTYLNDNESYMTFLGSAGFFSHSNSWIYNNVYPVETYQLNDLAYQSRVSYYYGYTPGIFTFPGISINPIEYYYLPDVLAEEQAGAYSDGYDEGLSIGYTDGYDQGEVAGYSSGYDEGSSQGYIDGYSDGSYYQAPSGWFWVKDSIKVLASFLDITIFPNVTLGTLLGGAIAIAIGIFVLRLLIL